MTSAVVADGHDRGDGAAGVECHTEGIGQPPWRNEYALISACAV